MTTPKPVTGARAPQARRAANEAPTLAQLEKRGKLKEDGKNYESPFSLMLGHQGEAVAQVRTMLGLPPSNKVDQSMVEAVKAFQQKNPPLEVDGKVGCNTLAKLKAPAEPPADEPAGPVDGAVPGAPAGPAGRPPAPGAADASGMDSARPPAQVDIAAQDRAPSPIGQAVERLLGKSVELAGLPLTPAQVTKLGEVFTAGGQLSTVQDITAEQLAAIALKLKELGSAAQAQGFGALLPNDPFFKDASRVQMVGQVAAEVERLNQFRQSQGNAPSGAAGSTDPAAGASRPDEAALNQSVANLIGQVAQNGSVQVAPEAMLALVDAIEKGSGPPELAQLPLAKLAELLKKEGERLSKLEGKEEVERLVPEGDPLRQLQNSKMMGMMFANIAKGIEDLASPGAPAPGAEAPETAAPATPATTPEEER